MAEEMLTSRSDFGKTFTAAMWLLGTLAAAQVFAVGWAIVTRPVSPPTAGVGVGVAVGMGAAADSNGNTGTGTMPSESEGGPVIENFDPFSEGVISDLAALSHPGLAPAEAPRIISSGPSTGPVATPPPSSLNDSLLPGPNLEATDTREPLSVALASATIASAALHPIPDPAIANLVSSGAELRSAGNMQASLLALRQAEAALPEHPRVLSELAGTYTEMGLLQKAAIYWKKVQQIGSDGDAFVDLADRELNADRGESAAARKLLRLGRISVTPDYTAAAGERVVLRVPVEAHAGGQPAAADMTLGIYFFDLVNGKTPEKTTADIAENFISAPYDWQDSGTELIEVIYHQPVFTPEQLREIGERAYYGYIVELYYRGRLQDTAADPPDLSNLDPTSPARPVESPAGPDGSLFPTTPQNTENE